MTKIFIQAEYDVIKELIKVRERMLQCYYKTTFYTEAESLAEESKAMLQEVIVKLKAAAEVMIK